MKARDLLVSGLLAGALAAMATVASAQTTRPPNIAVIMTDDVGWGDLGSYGGGAMRGAPTPNLDRLASEGMRFVNYYGQASCTAGRASFITGRIPIRTSLSAVLAPGDPNGLTKQTPTIAQYLKQANYTTVQLGKWHVGDKPENFPTANGFDEMYDMLPYYAGVYAYADKELHPSFPSRTNRSWRLGLGRSVPMGRQSGPGAHGREEDFTYADLSTGDDEMRARPSTG
jgi:arylsulfatase